jgi:hypothetical protein
LEGDIETHQRTADSRLMSLADYYQRAALAAAQVLSGFDSAAFEKQLDDNAVGISFGVQATQSREGVYLLDLLVRILARIYPKLELRSSSDAEHLAIQLKRLARTINPHITFVSKEAHLGIAVGPDSPTFETTVFAGSNGWLGLLSNKTPRLLGSSEIPFGCGAAACLAAGTIFRMLFLKPDLSVEGDVKFSTFNLDRGGKKAPPSGQASTGQNGVLVGLGAIGNAAAWALARSPLTGTIHLVDPETIELGNLQRYVLANRSDVNRSKVEVGKRAFRGSLRASPHMMPWSEFVGRFGYQWQSVLVALDTAQDRRAVQSSLPRWIANGWTQPGDLGVSIHPRFGETGACLACLYLPDKQDKNEDQLIAEALRIPQRILEVRSLLHLGGAVSSDLLADVARAWTVAPDRIRQFEGEPIRKLYIEGICGGALIPLDQVGGPRADVHVPMAHQSSLAGVLLAAAFFRSRVDSFPNSVASRINILRPLGSELHQPILRRYDGRCLCDDSDFVTAYQQKFQEH